MDSPVSAALTGWLVVPEPTDWDDVLAEVVSVESVPHSNHAFVASPLAVTLPFRVAEVAPTEVAAKVVTAGVAPGVKLRINPFDVPTELEAATRK
jgi:hypothetical protein